MNKAKGYYIFWASAVAIFAIVMASSVIGLQYWINNTQSCPSPHYHLHDLSKTPIPKGGMFN